MGFWMSRHLSRQHLAAQLFCWTEVLACVTAPCCCREGWASHWVTPCSAETCENTKWYSPPPFGTRPASAEMSHLGCCSLRKHWPEAWRKAARAWCRKGWKELGLFPPGKRKTEKTCNKVFTIKNSSCKGDRRL